MGSIPPNFPISLQSWPSQESSSSSSAALPTLLQRINFERFDKGGFRDLTEESLRQEIATAEAEQEDGSSDDEGEEEASDQLKELYATREELLNYLAEARYGAMQALDFVSLLLSKDQPRTAVETMSDLLKQKVPLGTLGMDRISEPWTTEAQKEDDKMVAKGWKIQNLTKSVDVILASATRLEKEIEVETKYWEQVLSIDEGGWKVCRIPQEKHILGVRFGFLEGADAFKNRSLAALRRGPNGAITLDQGIQATEPKILRVRIRSDGQFGSSVIPTPIANDGPVESRILQARNTSFASELWQELTREARTLMSSGVRMEDDTITCPFTKNKTLILDLVSLEDTCTPPPHPDDKIAEGVCLALHLLLTYAHRGNHHRRTKPPAPLRATEKHIPEYSLIRPLLARLSHQRSIELVNELLDPLVGILSSAGFSASYVQEFGGPTPNLSIAPTERTIRSLIDNLELTTIFHILPSVIIKIVARTHLFPIASTSYKIYLAPEFCPLLQTCPAPSGREFEEAPIESWAQVENYVLFATSCALASSVLASQPPEPEHGDTDEIERWLPSVQPNVLRRKNLSSGEHKMLTFTVERPKSTKAVKPDKDKIVRFKVTWESDGRKTGRGSYDWVGGGGKTVNTAKKEIEEVVKVLADVVADVTKA